MNDLNSLGLASVFARGDSCIVMNAGNAGDAVIALGIRHYLQRIDAAEVPIFPSWHEDILKFGTVVFGGGGSLVPFYPHSIAFISRVVQAGKDVIVLPHTTFGLEAELTAMSSRLTLVCREDISHRRLIAAGFPDERLGLDHDMAFQIAPEFFEAFPINGDGIANCFRTDGERRVDARPTPDNNLDISLSWNGELWHNSRLTEAVSKSLVAYLSGFNAVHTDRLHVGILGARLGLTTILFENSYYKNRAVFEHSISPRFPNAKLQMA